MKKQLKINMEFCDDWIKGLVKDILALEFECQENNEDYDYIVCDSSYLFQPFSEVVKKIKRDVVAIFMTGEAIAPDFNLFDYAVVFDEILFKDRCLDIKYFGDAFKDVLVKNIDVQKTLKSKSGFCNFIYSNPLAHPNRDAFFHKLSEYKKVDSYGKHLNNMNCDDTRGDANWNGLLVDVKSKYKFSIAFENASHLGYTTEKIVTSMKANSLPIYWGNPDVVKYFNPKSFLNCHDYADFDEVVKKIIELDNDDAKWQKMMEEPWMSEKQVQDYQEKVCNVKEAFSNIFRQDKVTALRKGSGTWNDLYREVLGGKSQPKKGKKSYKLLGMPIMKIKKTDTGKTKYIFCGITVLKNSQTGSSSKWSFMGMPLYAYKKNWDNIEYKILFFKFKKFINYIPLDKADLSCKPVEPWAFVRVKNEIKTIDACLKSILPVIKKGVIGFNDCDDGSKEYILDFCEKNPGFIAFEYPFSVVPGNMEGAENIPAEQRLDGYYNAVLAKIPQNEWIIKIDCDHIFDTEKLRKMCYLPQNKKDCVVLSRLNLHYDGDVYVTDNPFCNAGDSWIVYNEGLQYKFKKVDDDAYYKYYEILPLDGHHFIFTDCTNWHFPFVKNYRKADKSKFDTFAKYKKYISKENLKKITPDMLDEKRIKKLCEGFDLVD